MTLRQVLGAALVAAAFSCSVWAQSQSATLSGTVTDNSGAVIPGVHVKVSNIETGEALSGESNDSGTYVIPLIKPGRYNLSAEKQGFKQSQQSGLVMETGAQLRVDLSLEVGALSERVLVEAQSSLLQSETSSIGSVVDNRTIVNMPLIDRRAAQLARLNGFVVQNGAGGSNFTMAGGRGDNSMWLIDGGNAQNVLLGVQTLTFNPPVESLQEFNVSISNYSAELGRTGGGVVQMTTKSGTNKFRGSAYEFLRNDKFDARTFFAADKAKLRYNLFGASIGGPVIKDKTHFFFNYEGLRQDREVTVTQNIPTRAETRGDFSQGSTVIRDPAAAGRPPFAGNIIPASRLDPIGVQIAAFYPEPNVAGRPSGNSNFRVNQGTHAPANTYVARIDHVFRANDRMYGRLLANLADNIEDPIYPTAGVDEVHRIRNNSYYNLGGTWFHNFTPSTINEFRYAWDKRTFINRIGGAHLGLAGKIGIKGVDPDFFPRITLTGYAGFANNSNQERLQLPIVTHHVVDHVLMIRGNHSLKAGFETRIGRNDDLNKNRPGGQFAFNNVATGHGLAALLLGWAQSATLDAAQLVRSRADTVGGFIQDDWKVTPHLTLNLGLRWDMDTPRREAIDNRQSSFDLNAINPVSGTPGVVTFSGRNGVSRYAHDFDANNFGPRFGFAWRVRDNWVIRGGASIVYTGAYDQATPLVSNLGFSTQGDFASPDNGLTPALLLKDGIPPIKQATEADLTPGFGAVRVGQPPNTSVEFFLKNRRTGYLETFNFNIQRRLPGQMLVEIGYLSTLGHKLPAPASFTLNQVRPELMGPGNIQSKRPFPQFTNVTILAPAFGNSNYHGVNLRLEKRYSHGFHFQMNYTFARSIDDVESRNELGGNPGDAYQNAYDRRGDRGLSGNHIKQRLIWSSVYELPVGSGRAFDPGNRVLRQILGGWSAGLIAEFRTGTPIGVSEQTNTTNAFSPQQRSNVVGNPNDLPDGRSTAEKIDRWFNIAAFAAPAQFTFGNSGRTTGYAPGAIVGDLSILKSFRLAEARSLEFRTEMLNFLNHANFGLPNLSRGSAPFGRITSLQVGNEARIVQFGLQLRF